MVKDTYRIQSEATDVDVADGQILNPLVRITKGTASVPSQKVWML